jgi:hypothetical protein
MIGERKKDVAICADGPCAGTIIRQDHGHVVVGGKMVKAFYEFRDEERADGKRCQTAYFKGYEDDEVKP